MYYSVQEYDDIIGVWLEIHCAETRKEAKAEIEVVRVYGTKYRIEVMNLCAICMTNNCTNPAHNA